jgi:hypothetical protein
MSPTFPIVSTSGSPVFEAEGPPEPEATLTESEAAYLRSVTDAFPALERLDALESYGSPEEPEAFGGPDPSGLPWAREGDPEGDLEGDPEQATGLQREPVLGEARDDDMTDIAERVAARSRVRAGGSELEAGWETGFESGLEAEDERPRTVRWTTCFTADDAARAVGAYTENHTAATSSGAQDRCSCIVMLNVALGRLLDLSTKPWPARGYKPGTHPARPRTVQMADLTTQTVDLAMAQLVRAGRATGPVRLDFVDKRGRRAGTLEPVRLSSSVLTAVTERSRDKGCWYGFGMSVMDGYHSVLLLVDHIGDDRKIYWMDQFSNGLDVEVTTTLDDKLTAYTVSAWNSVLRSKGKRFDTPIRLWQLRRPA